MNGTWTAVSKYLHIRQSDRMLRAVLQKWNFMIRLHLSNVLLSVPYAVFENLGTPKQAKAFDDFVSFTWIVRSPRTGCSVSIASSTLGVIVGAHWSPFPPAWVFSDAAAIVLSVRVSRAWVLTAPSTFTPSATGTASPTHFYGRSVGIRSTWSSIRASSANKSLLKCTKTQWSQKYFLQLSGIRKTMP